MVALLTFVDDPRRHPKDEVELNRYLIPTLSSESCEGISGSGAPYFDTNLLIHTILPLLDLLF